MGFARRMGMTIGMSIVSAVIFTSIFVYAGPLFPSADEAGDIFEEGLTHISGLADRPGIASQSTDKKSEVIAGKVTRNVDGDTLHIDGIKIRLALVNTAERGEPGYRESSQFVKDTCPVGSVATYDQDDGQKYDRYGRSIAKVWCFGNPASTPDESLNAILVSEGHAEIFCQFAPKSEFGNDYWAAASC